MEGFATAAQQNVLTAQELQALGFSQDVQSNPAAYQTYVQSNIDQLMNQTLTQKRDAFKKSYIDTGRYMDMDHNAQLYKTRSSDVDKLETIIQDVNTKYEVGLDHDKKLSRRQFELNEWAYNNKLETLFLLQLLFISVLLLVVLLFLNKQGYISKVVAGSVAVLLFVAIAYIGYYRWNYTNKTRDTRLWSRRSFTPEGSGPATPVGHCDAQGNYNIDLKQLIPDVLSQNLSSITDKVQQVSSELNNQALNYETTGGLPTAAPTCTPPP